MRENMENGSKKEFDFSDTKVEKPKTAVTEALRTVKEMAQAAVKAKAKESAEKPAKLAGTREAIANISDKEIDDALNNLEGTEEATELSDEDIEELN